MTDGIVVCKMSHAIRRSTCHFTRHVSLQRRVLNVSNFNVDGTFYTPSQRRFTHLECHVCWNVQRRVLRFRRLTNVLHVQNVIVQKTHNVGFKQPILENNYRAWEFTSKEAIWLVVTGSWPLKTRRLHSINGHFSTSRWRYLVTVAKQTTT